MHCFYQFLLMSSIFTRILSLAHLFYAYFTHGPNKSASAQYDNTRGAWLAQEGCTLTERKEGRKGILFQICYEYKVRRLNNILIVGNLRDADIRQCIHSQTNLIYCVNSH